MANSTDNVPVTVDDLGVTGACTALMREALKPTLMQTLEVCVLFVFILHGVKKMGIYKNKLIVYVKTNQMFTDKNMQR